MRSTLLCRDPMGPEGQRVTKTGGRTKMEGLCEKLKNTLLLLNRIQSQSTFLL